MKKKPEIKSARNVSARKSAKSAGKSAPAAAAEPSAGPGPKVGRPREPRADMPIYDSMQQCAAATGVPLSALKMAKAAGCDAFRHGRIEFGGFIRWFFAREGDESTDWNRENKRLDALIKRVRLAEMEKRAIDFRAVERFLQVLVGQKFFGELERLAQEFPPTLKGKNELQIRAHVDREIGNIKKDLAAKLQEMLPKA